VGGGATWHHGRVRMFVAVVPPPDVLDGLAGFLEPRRGADPGVRWASAEQWHLTLAFLADVPERRLDDLIERLARAAARRHPLDLRLRGSGAFPSPARSKVLWVGVHATPAEELDRLAAGSRAAGVKAGVEVRGGRFRPHLTVARLRHPVDATRWIRVLDAYGSNVWTAGRVDLIESHLGQGPGDRSRYVTLQTFELGRPRAVVVSRPH
jgi:RNA 2',3'-cyclic 3'-phosphodiesterase